MPWRITTGASPTAKKEFRQGDCRYSEAIRLDPKYAEAYDNRGFNHGAKGDFDKEIADFAEAIRLNPQLANAYNNRGNGYHNKVLTQGDCRLQRGHPAGPEIRRSV